MTASWHIRLLHPAVLGVLLALSFQAAAPAAEMDRDLISVLRTAAPGDEIPVIIYHAQKADIRRFSADDTNRLDRDDLRRDLVRTLRAQAAVDLPAIERDLRMFGARGTKKLWLVNGMATKLPARFIQRMSRSPNISRIVLDAAVSQPVTTQGIAGPAEWNIDATRAPELWASGYQGQGMVVATMDTGVDPDHQDLLGRWRGGSNSWFDPHGQHALPYDANGHGTAVMGVLAGGNAGGSAIGMAPQAQWIAVKLFNDLGDSSFSTIHQAFQWLVDPDGDPATDDAPTVVNGSWGFDAAGICDTEFQADVEALKAAGIAVVFAAGNDGPAAWTDSSPANYTASLAAGAVNSLNQVAASSSRGPSSCDDTIFPEVVAPGVDILSADITFNGLFPDSYMLVSGTSFAAPHVAGAIALLRGAFPALDVAEIEAAIKDSALDLGTPGPDNEAGYGLLDVMQAYTLLEAAVGTPPPDPIPDPIPDPAPVATADSFAVNEDNTIVVDAPGVLGNDSPAGLTAVLDSAVTVGTLALYADGSFTYTPPANFNGSATFTYVASDGTRTSAPAMVTINVAAVNDPPVANADGPFSTFAGVALNVGAPGVLGNDTDVDSSGLTAALVPGSAIGGSVTLNPNGSFQYTPTAGFTGAGSFRYFANDGAANSAVAATVSINVAPQANTAPVARNDSARTGRNAAVTINVLANDTDAQNNIVPSTVTIVRKPSRGGTAAVNADGTVSYTPRRNFSGTEVFTYRVRDSAGAVSNTARVTVNVSRKEQLFAMAQGRGRHHGK